MPILSPPATPQTFSFAAGGEPIKTVLGELRRFGERLGLPPPLLDETSLTVEELERKLQRHQVTSARISVRVFEGDVVVEWTASSVRITTEDSRAWYIGPLPQAAGRGSAPSPSRDSPVTGSGWRWMQSGKLQATLLERPHPREAQSGDMALVERRGDKLRLAIIDGLGHGPLAREAAQRAVESLRASLHLDIQEAVLRAHEQLGSTRGGTLGLADLSLEARTIRATTVGNSRVVLFFGGGRVWSPCGTDAVLGHGRGGSHGRLDVRVEQHPWPNDSILAMFSDGLLNQLRLPWQRTDLDELAAQLFHTFSVATDDATLLLLG